MLKLKLFLFVSFVIVHWALCDEVIFVFYFIRIEGACLFTQFK